MMNITERELLERLRNNLNERLSFNKEELFTDVAIAFEDAEIDEETEVIVTECGEGILKAYLNHVDSPIYFIEYKDIANVRYMVKNVYM